MTSGARTWARSLRPAGRSLIIATTLAAVAAPAAFADVAVSAPAPSAAAVSPQLGQASAPAASAPVLPPADKGGVPEWLRKVRDDPDRERKAQLDRRIDALRGDLAETSAELVVASEKLESTRAALPGVRAAVEKADAELAKAEASHDDLASRLAEARIRESQAAEDLTTAQRSESAIQGQLSALARESYMSGGFGDFSLTLDAVGSGEDPGARLAMTQSVLRYQDGMLRSLADSQARTRADQDRLAGIRKDLAALEAEAAKAVTAKQSAKDTADRERARLEELESQQETLVAEVSAEKQKARDALQQTEQEAADLHKVLYQRYLKAKEAERQRKLELARKEKLRKQRIAEAKRKARLAAIKREKARKAKLAAKRRAERAAALKRERQALLEQRRASRDAKRQELADRQAKKKQREVERVQNGPLIWPAATYITSEFGLRFHPIFHIWRLHSGTDFGGGCGVPVKAAADGQIIMMNWTTGQGRRMVIDHGWKRGVNLSTVYAHLDGYAVGGGYVKQGQTIGYIGNTGNSTGCHLHFETHENGTPVNPRTWW